MKAPFRAGQLVYLRPVERADAAVIQPWFNDPEVTRTLKRWRPLTLGAEQAFIEEMDKQEDLFLGIARRADDVLVGVTGLHEIDWQARNAMFGITIGDRAAQGQGFGSEATRLLLACAFDTMNLHRVWLRVHATNERAIRVYEKVGFRREGVLRQDSFREGRYLDSLFMAVLREEWK